MNDILFLLTVPVIVTLMAAGVVWHSNRQAGAALQASEAEAKDAKVPLQSGKFGGRDKLFTAIRVTYSGRRE
ncbi:hypothetical protein LOC51_24330 [Rubrivivax sp. JA1024]|nr:hypothetical protein [Rubrivivax sp. JA1024]